jgi:mono/diheme cytochrome c family protein
MKKVFLIIGMITIFLTGCVPEPQSIIEKGKAKKGEEIFSERCARCHGKNARGKIGPSLISSKVKEDIEKSKEGGFVEKTISEGRNKMPPFQSKLTHQEIHEILSYLLSIQEE